MNTFIRGRAWPIIAFMSLILAGAAHAQNNSLANPGFDTDLSGWDIFENRIGEWSQEDADGSGSSGSALLMNRGTSNGNVPLVLHQCIVAQPGVEYRFGGDAMVLPDQPVATAAFIFVQAFSSADCGGSNVQLEEVSTNTIGQWIAIEDSITVGPGVQSLRIGLGVFKGIGQTGDAEAHYDNIYLLVPDPADLEPSKSASWYNPDESGHGIMIHLLDETTAWLCWFTFDLDGNPAWICALGEIDGDTITFNEAFTIEGGAFPPNFDPEQITEVPWGAIMVQFTGCSAGNMSWTTSAPGFQSGQMPIVRLTTTWGATCQEG